MLSNRILGAFTFRQGVYAEVEADESFTNTAWTLAALAYFLRQAGANFSYLMDGAIVRWLLSTVGFTIFSLVGFAAAVYVIVLVGKEVFKAQVDFGEMVRTLGLASVWQSLGAVAIVTFLFPTVLTCLLAPLNIAIGILGLVAFFVAAKEALDLESLQTAVTIIIGWLVMLVVGFIGGIILGIFGVVAAGAANLLG